LWIDGVTVDDDELTVPHPRMYQRNFVVVPLLEIAPDLQADLAALGYDEAEAFGEVRSLGSLRSF